MRYILTLLGFGLLVITTLFLSDNADAKTQVRKSDSNQGITFTIDDYKKKATNLTIFYTVTSNNKLEGNKVRQPFLDRPNFYVNGKFLNTSFSEDLKKISDNKYTGSISIRLKDIQEHFIFTFDINRISNKVGHWELKIEI